MHTNRKVLVSYDKYPYIKFGAIPCNRGPDMSKKKNYFEHPTKLNVFCIFNLMEFYPTVAEVYF